MKKLIVYFHGLNSSPNTDKVNRLRAMFPNDLVYAFSANVDPEIALKEVGEEIKLVLAEHYNTPGEVYFIGTSLGAWLASKLSDEFNVKALLINPSYTPRESLKKYPEIDNDVREKYTDLDISFRSQMKTYAVDPFDEVIDMKPLLDSDSACGSTFFFYPNVGHRFNGPEFETVVKAFVG
jgi:predicted esterase YcpF (UPF0227 family)